MLLNAIQEALADVFGRMNAQFAARQFEFSNDIAHSIQRFLVRFDAIFTLNQDLLIEVHYKKSERRDLTRHTLARIRAAGLARTTFGRSSCWSGTVQVGAAGPVCANTEHAAVLQA